MRRAPPLAALALLSAALAAPAAVVPSPDLTLREGEACPLLDQEGRTGLLPGIHADCVAFNRTIPDFARLRRAAGFAPEALRYFVDPDTTSVNAYYWIPSKSVHLKRGYLAAGMTPAAFRMVQAHEIGHAVQDRDGTLAWRNQVAEDYARASTAPFTWAAFEASSRYPEYLARNRRVEAQADAIAQELLVAAGFPRGELARGTEGFFGCQAPGAISSPVTTHPAHAQRHVNAALAHSTLASARSRAALERTAAALGGGQRAVEDSGAPPPTFRPLTTVQDFDDRGQFKPGRIVSMKLRVDPPPPNAGPVREHATRIAASFVDFWIADPMQKAIDALARDRDLAGHILESCGGPEAVYNEREFGVMSWIGAMSEEAVARLFRRGKDESVARTLELPGMTIRAEAPKPGTGSSEPPPKNPGR